MDISHLLYVVFLTAAFAAAILWAFLTLFQYVKSQVRPSGEIVVGTFTASGQGLPTDTKAVASALASKMERLKRVATREPSGFGLVQSPILTSVPDQVSERQSDARKRLEDLNLKVKDVDVNAVVKAIRSVFAPARPTLEGQVTEIGDRLEIRAELFWKGNTIGGWVASRIKTAQIQDTLNDLYDDLLFQITYDIPRNPKLHWWAEAKGTDEIPNWQALEAVTLGLESLQTYGQSLEYADLQRAIKYLERVPVHAPGYALGHYFLAVALGEDRQEERAASLLAQVERMQTGKTLKWSASFQRAAAMLRRYRTTPAEEAAKDVLEPLVNELLSTSSTANNGKNSAEEKAFASRLLPLAFAQLAYTYGTLLTLKSNWTNEELERRSTAASEQALATFNQSSTVWSSPREQKEVERWIYNTRGYSKFRIAQFKRSEAVNAHQPLVQVNKNFRTACEDALVDLRKANEILPNNYEVLQNQGMILDDEDYDHEGTQLSEAETLYERTKLFVPRDYYQYERLAIIYQRQLKSNPPASLQSTLIDKGQKAVSSATVYRYPEKSRTAAVLGAYFTAWEAKLETDAAKKRSKLSAAVNQAKLAVDLKAPRNLALDTAELMTEVADGLKDTDTEEKVLKVKVLEMATHLKAL